MDAALAQSMAVWKRELEIELDGLRQGLIEAQKEIALKEGQLEHIIELLRSEGMDEGLNGMGKTEAASLSDHAYEVLKDKGTPFYYRDLVEYLQSNGVIVPGKDPAANLIAHISRDNRFVRIARGTYALQEWGGTKNRTGKE